MKGKILFVGLIFSVLLFSCKEDPAAKVNRANLESAQKRDYEIKYESAVMKFENSEFDFGTIDEGDIVETVFNFTNTGKKELIITAAKSTCGCTIPNWPKEPILSGETGQIKVKFNSNGKPNKQQKRITLATNTQTGKELLMIKAFVNPKKK